MKIPGKFLVIFLIHIGLIYPAKAYEKIKWYDGVIILSNHEVINCELNINQKFNTVQSKEGTTVRSHPAREIEKITFYDTDLETPRFFISIPVNDHLILKYEFYEIVIRGKVKLISREKDYSITVEKYLNVFLNSSESATRNYVSNQNFYFFDGKNIIPLQKFCKLVLPAFKMYFNHEISSYIQEAKLNVNLPRDQMKVLKYFNKLYSEKIIFARSHS